MLENARPLKPLSVEELRERVARVQGIFVGFLDDEELDIFDAACAAGVAYRSYQGAAGFMGLAKVALQSQEP